MHITRGELCPGGCSTANRGSVDSDICSVERLYNLKLKMGSERSVDDETTKASEEPIVPHTESDQEPTVSDDLKSETEVASTNEPEQDHAKGKKKDELEESMDDLQEPSEPSIESQAETQEKLPEAGENPVELVAGNIVPREHECNDEPETKDGTVAQEEAKTLTDTEAEKVTVDDNGAGDSGKVAVPESEERTVATETCAVEDVKEKEATEHSDRQDEESWDLVPDEPNSTNEADSESTIEADTGTSEESKNEIPAQTIDQSEQFLEEAPKEEVSVDDATRDDEEADEPTEDSLLDVQDTPQNVKESEPVQDPASELVEEAKPSSSTEQSVETSELPAKLTETGLQTQDDAQIEGGNEDTVTSGDSLGATSPDAEEQLCKTGEDESSEEASGSNDAPLQDEDERSIESKVSEQSTRQEEKSPAGNSNDEAEVERDLASNVSPEEKHEQEIANDSLTLNQETAGTEPIAGSDDDSATGAPDAESIIGDHDQDSVEKEQKIEETVDPAGNENHTNTTEEESVEEAHSEITASKETLTSASEVEQVTEDGAVADAKDIESQPKTENEEAHLESTEVAAEEQADALRCDSNDSETAGEDSDSDTGKNKTEIEKNEADESTEGVKAVEATPDEASTQEDSEIDEAKDTVKSSVKSISDSDEEGNFGNKDEKDTARTVTAEESSDESEEDSDSAEESESEESSGASTSEEEEDDDEEEEDSQPPIYLYTSLTAGGYHVMSDTNRLMTILKANDIEFTVVDLATNERAKRIWKWRSNGRKLPGVVRDDEVVGDYKEIEAANEMAEVRSLVLEEDY